VQKTIDNISKEQENITDLICVYQDREGVVGWKCTEGSTLERIVSMLETTKINLLVSPEENEQEREENNNGH
jgi:hypothetical protein